MLFCEIIFSWFSLSQTLMTQSIAYVRVIFAWCLLYNTSEVHLISKYESRQDKCVWKRSVNRCFIFCCCFPNYGIAFFLSWYRLKDIHSYVGNEIACVLVATRCDVSSRKREVTSESALAFAHKRELPLIELSSLDKQNVDRIFKLLTDLILNRYLNKDCETRVNNTIKLGTTKQEKNDSCIC